MTTDLIKTACVFCHGRVNNPAIAKQTAMECDLLIAADGGEKHCREMGLVPQVIIGDMDSVKSDIWKNKKCTDHLYYSANNDKFDTEIAVKYAFGKGCQQVSLLGATGGNIDHTLANIAIVASYPGQVAILDGNSTLIAVDEKKKCTLHGNIGTTVSLIPYDVKFPVLKTRGLKYSFQNEKLKSVTQGLNNELSKIEACVCVTNGKILVYIENKK